MPIEYSSRIVGRWRLERMNKATGEFKQDWLLAVVPPGMPIIPEPEFIESERKAYVAAAMQGASDPAGAAIQAMAIWSQGGSKGASPAAAAVRRWRARHLWYVAADRFGDELRRALPFQWPADPVAEGLFQIRLTPDGRPDLVPEADERYPDATVNPDACLVTRSDDPMVVARWWWAFHFGGFPREVEVKMYVNQDGERVHLTRTEG